MDNSILYDVRKRLGIADEDTDFTSDVVSCTNSALFILNQMGIGKEGFYITPSGTEKWSDFLTGKQLNLRAVKDWVALKVKMMFDPPTSSIVKQSLDEMLKELEWRIYITENYTYEDFERNYGGVSEFDRIGISSSITNLQPYLFELTYNNLDYDYAHQYFFNRNHYFLNMTGGGCSSVRNGNWYGRNFDWTYGEGAEFIVHTNAEGKFKSVGIAGQIGELTNSFVMSGKYSDLYKLVPFMIVDGINEKGLVCNVNVVPNDHGDNNGTIPADEPKETISSLMVPRYVLDNFATARGAVNYLKNYVSIYVPKQLQLMDYSVHFMIADATDTYLVEFFGNELRSIEISSKPYMTNFYLLGVTFNSDGTVCTPADVESGRLPSVINGITDHGSGLERYNLIVNEYQNANSKDGMFDLMTKLRFTNAYKNSTDPYWYSEFVGTRGLTVDSPVSQYQEVLPIIQEAFRKRKRTGAFPETWQTCHTSVYDLENKRLYLVSQEFYDTVYGINI